MLDSWQHQLSQCLAIYSSIDEQGKDMSSESDFTLTDYLSLFYIYKGVALLIISDLSTVGQCLNWIFKNNRI